MDKQNFVGLWQVVEATYEEGEVKWECNEDKMLAWAEGKSDDESVFDFLYSAQWTGEDVPGLFLKIENDGTIHQIDKTECPVLPTKKLGGSEVEAGDAFKFLTPDFTEWKLGTTEEFSHKIGSDVELKGEKIFLPTWKETGDSPWSDCIHLEDDLLIREVRVVWEWTYPMRWILKYRRTQGIEQEQKEERIKDCIGKWQLEKVSYLYEKLNPDNLNDEQEEKIREWIRGEVPAPGIKFKNTVLTALSVKISEYAEWENPEKLRHVKLEIKEDGSIIQTIEQTSPIKPDLSGRMNFSGEEASSKPLLLSLVNQEGEICIVGEDDSLSHKITTVSEDTVLPVKAFKEVIIKGRHIEIIDILFKKKKRIFREIRLLQDNSEIYSWILTYSKCE